MKVLRFVVTMIVALPLGLTTAAGYVARVFYVAWRIGWDVGGDRIDEELKKVRA